MPLFQQFFMNSFGAAGSHLDRGLYSSSHNMYGNTPSGGNDIIEAVSLSFWYYHTFEISANNILMFNSWNGGANDYSGVGINGSGALRYRVHYNYSPYHNLTATLTSSQLAANKWHHFHQENNQSTVGSNANKVYIDGTLMLQANANNYVDCWHERWGDMGSYISYVRSIVSATSDSVIKSPTYMAQMVWAQGANVPDIDEVLNSTSDGPRNLLDINGDGTNVVLDTDRPGTVRTDHSAIFLFGANSTTDSDTHNSASQQGGTNFSVNNATRTQDEPFPVPSEGDW